VTPCAARVPVTVCVLAGLCAGEGKPGASDLAAQETDPAAEGGVWTGSLAVLGQDLGFRVAFRREGDSLRATMDIPAQGAHELELIHVAATSARVHFELEAGPGLAVWDGRMVDGVVEGEFTQGGARGTFHMARGEAPPPPATAVETRPYRSDELEFANGDVRLSGTLTVPEGSGPFPAVVLLSGSGPQDRDSDLLGFPVFRVLADHLTRSGIAVLRYDDRGVGGSTGSVFLSTTDDFADDALAAIRSLAGLPDIDPDRIGLFGHSEGAVVAPLAASRSETVAFVVLLAGTTVPGAEVIYEQGAAIARVAGASEADIASGRDLQQRMFETLVNGGDLAPFLPEVEASIRERIAALPAAERDAIVDVDEYVGRQAAAQIQQIQTPWFRFFLAYDPIPALRATTVPVLALFGERDLQVTPAQNMGPMTDALRDNPDATLQVVPGANHLFQSAGTGSPSEYATLDSRFAPGVLETISDWILARFSS